MSAATGPCVGCGCTAAIANATMRRQCHGRARSRRGGLSPNSQHESVEERGAERGRTVGIRSAAGSRPRPHGHTLTGRCEGSGTSCLRDYGRAGRATRRVCRPDEGRTGPGATGAGLVSGPLLGETTAAPMTADRQVAAAAERRRCFRVKHGRCIRLRVAVDSGRRRSRMTLPVSSNCVCV